MISGRNAGSGHRGGYVTGGAEPPVESWHKFRGWGDTIRWPLALVVGCMLVVAIADALWLANATTPDVAATLTGIAAVVGALAAVIKAKRGSANATTLADHEARLRVLEDRGTR